jgi:hypothetical protein
MTQRTPLQTVALLTGIVLLLVGILGFIPGITSDAPGSFSGRDSDAELFGIFQVSILLNIVHLLYGLVGIALATTWDGARTFLIGGGVIFLLLWILGLIGGTNWIPTDAADDWLHFVLGVGMVGAGFLLGREAMTRTTVTAP